MLSTGAANADTFVPLPDQTVTQTLQDGSVVTLTLTEDSATINPSMGSTPLHRNAWVSGRVKVSMTNGQAIDGWVWPGYVVGCQIDINGGGVSESATASATSSTTTASSGSTATLSLGPGQAQTFSLLDIERPTPFGDDANYPFNYFHSTNTSGVHWEDTTIALNGCAGYAQARAFAKVRIQTKYAVGSVNVWGPPFSLG
jgi:hypothetical protein